MHWYAKTNSDLDVSYCECEEDYVRDIVTSIVNGIWKNVNLEKIKNAVKNHTSADSETVSKHEIGDIEDVKIFLVNGNEVKTKLFMDFVEGGHDLVYGKTHIKTSPAYIPDKEIWVDADLDISSFPYVLLHECIERHIMKTKGISYDEAHERANGVEKIFRKRKFFEKNKAGAATRS